MRDHNEAHEPPEHREHPNPQPRLTFTPWAGDNFEDPEEQPCEPAPERPAPEPLELITPELVLAGDAFWGWSRVWARP